MSMVRNALPFTLEAPEDLFDGAGGVTRVWAPKGTLWGQLKARGGRERLRGAAGVAETNLSVVVRGAPVGAPSRPDVRQRLRLGARLFRIVAVLEADPAGRQLECRVIEEVTL